MEYRSRTFRIDDEVWEAVQKHDLSANQLLRRVLGLSGESVIVKHPPVRSSQLDVVGPDLLSGRGKASTETFSRGPRPKGDKTR